MNLFASLKGYLKDMIMNLKYIQSVYIMFSHKWAIELADVIRCSLDFIKVNKVNFVRIDWGCQAIYIHIDKYKWFYASINTSH